MKLKLKIFLGFLILAVMLCAAGGWSIYQMSRFSKTVDEIISDNYESVVFAKNMRDALEREDSAILLLLHHSSAKADSMLESADKNFVAALNNSRENITLEGENKVVEKISSDYDEFKLHWVNLKTGNVLNASLDWYNKNVHKYFLKVMNSIDELATLNNNALYNTSIDVREQARRALLPGIVAVITAILFTIMFSYFVNIFMITPLIEITKGMNNFIYKQIPFNYRAPSKDEISKLAETAQALISYNQDLESNK